MTQLQSRTPRTAQPEVLPGLCDSQSSAPGISSPPIWLGRESRGGGACSSRDTVVLKGLRQGGGGCPSTAPGPVSVTWLGFTCPAEQGQSGCLFCN